VMEKVMEREGGRKRKERSVLRLLSCGAIREPCERHPTLRQR
jgi:hypothetical protein